MNDKMMMAIARAQTAPWMARIEVLVSGDGWVAPPLVCSEVTPENELEIRHPTFCLSRDAAQTLMDDLWACGLRPTEGTGSAGALAAVERHIKDLQRLVFDGAIGGANDRD